MPVIPQRVSDGTQARTAWANAVQAWLVELGAVTAKGDLLVGAGSQDLAKLALANPSETQGKAVLTGDFTTKDITWEKQEALSEYATKKGNLLWVTGSPLQVRILPPPTTASKKHYLQAETNATGVITSVGWVTRDQLIAELIPQKSGTPRPSNVADGQLWIDTSA